MLKYIIIFQITLCIYKDLFYVQHSSNNAESAYSGKKVSSSQIAFDRAQPPAMRNFNNYESDIRSRRGAERESENRINHNINSDIRYNHR